MVNSGMHKQDIMHKELCGGVLAPNGFVIRLSLFNEDTNEDTIN